MCGIYKTKPMNKHNKTETVTDIENKQVVTRGEMVGGRKKIDEGD